jgi:hypothetical protein
LRLPLADRNRVFPGFHGQLPFHKKTEHFDFYSVRDSPRITEIARFADGYVKLINRDFFKANFDFPIRALVFEDRDQFQQFLRQKMDMPNPPGFGIYVNEPPNRFFATYEDSGMGTFAHEILHPLVERNLRDHPQWAMEGIPTFFEKFYGYWKGDELTVYWGYQNPWRIQALGENLTHLDLKKLVADTDQTEHYGSGEHSESAQRMASVFLWQQGRFKRFLNLVATRDKAGYPTYFEAAMQMPIEKILPLWQDYLDNVAAQRAKIMRLPPSKIFDDEANFQDFVRAWAISLDQPKTID